MVYDAGEQLRFEFQIKDSISGMIKSSVKQVLVPVKQIDQVLLQKGIFGCKWGGVKIIMQSIDLNSFKEIPGMKHGKIELLVSRENADQAQAFVDGLYTSN